MTEKDDESAGERALRAGSDAAGGEGEPVSVVDQLAAARARRRRARGDVAAAAAAAHDGQGAAGGEVQAGDALNESAFPAPADRSDFFFETFEDGEEGMHSPTPVGLANANAPSQAAPTVILEKRGEASGGEAISTPDGRSFQAGVAGAPLRLAWAAASAAGRQTGRIVGAVWRFAGWLDDALARGVLKGLASLWAFAVAATDFLADCVGDLLGWLPTPMGRAYCAGSAALAVVAGLWVFDELRNASGEMVDRELIVLPPDAAGDPIVARVDGRFVRLSDVRATYASTGFIEDDERLTARAAFERGLVQAYVEQRLLARAARDAGLQREADVAARLAVARDRILSGAYMEARIAEATRPERLRRLYDSQADLVRLGDEVRARHIVVGTEIEALAVVEDVAAGADFARLARERSLDPATAPKGGEIGYFTRHMMAKNLADAAFSTAVGEVAPPFASEFGWHVLEVLDRRPAPTVRFEEVADDIREYMRQRAVDDALREILGDADVLYFEPAEGAARGDRADLPVASGVVPPVNAAALGAGADLLDGFASPDESAGFRPGLREGATIELEVDPASADSSARSKREAAERDPK